MHRRTLGFLALLTLSACAAPKPELAPSAKPSPSAEVTPAATGPLIWRVGSQSGEISYILADKSSVVSKQLVPEVWSAFDQSTEVVLEQDINSFLPWLATREARLSSTVSKSDFQRLLIAAPGIPPDLLDRLPAFVLAKVLHAPNSARGDSIMVTVRNKAKESDKKVSFLVTDMNAYQEIYGAMLDELDELKVALADPEPGRRQARAVRRAYLLGDAQGVAAEREYAPPMIKLVEKGNEAWMAPLTSALDRGGVFAVISTVDLISPNGIIKRLKAGGYTVERAFPQAEPSMRLPAPQLLRIEECTEAFVSILRLQRPDLTEQFSSPEVVQAVLAEEAGRSFMALCRQQVTVWHDCVLDADSPKAVEACDKKHPIETD